MSRFWPLLLALTAGCPPPPGAPPPARVAFPSDFLWGTAVAQWQVEGDQGVNGPVESNWSRWAGMDRVDAAQRNPEGNGFHTLYAEDVDRAAALGLTHFRLSVDWSRIEPQVGSFDEDELDHLEGVIDAIRAAGMEPVLTLWHWVVPPWVQNPDPDAGDGRVDLMADADERDYFLERWELFVERVVARVKDRVDVYTVLNEPFSMISAAYIGGEFPPGAVLDLNAGIDFGLTCLFMQARGFDVIKRVDDVDADADGRDSWVGMTKTANAFLPLDPDDSHLRFAAEQVSYVFNHWYMRALVTGDLDVNLDRRIDDDTTEPPEGHYPDLEGRLEFVGVQYYGPVRLARREFLDDLHPLYAQPLLDVRDYDASLPHNGMGREISAAGFRHTIDMYAQWGVPIVLTENGTTTNRPPDEDAEDSPEPGERDEGHAAMFLVEHLWEVGRALDRGVDIRGYFHWTLADNFEWVEGHRQRFGAYAVDFDDPARPRTLTKMGEALRDVVEAGEIDRALWDAYVLDQYPSDTRADGGLTTTNGEAPSP
jgi:beta-glucosidase